MTAAGEVLAGLFLVGILLTDVFVGPLLADRTRRAISAGEPNARVHLHRLVVGFGWGFAALALAVLLLGGLSAAEIGFRAADLGGLTPVLVGGLVGLVAPIVVARRRGKPPPVVGDIGLLLPTTARERRWYAAAAVTAGVTEEISHRALPILLLLAVLPGHGRGPAVVLAALLFGLAHRYQGVAGMALTGVVGAGLGWVYVDSGSLWPSMALHVLLDLRLLLLPMAEPETPASPTQEEVEPP